jgi:hypothetical protein
MDCYGILRAPTNPAIWNTTERMTRNLVAALTVAILCTTLPFLTRTSGFQRPTQAPHTTLFITMGDRATSAETWDGSAEVNSGTITGLEGWHFLHRGTASGHSWRAAVRVDEVAPSSDPNYNELRGGEKPAPLYFPIGVYLTIEGLPTAHVSIHTTQGNFDFALDSISLEATPFLDRRAWISRVPSPEKITSSEFENDEPAAAVPPNGDLALAWVAYRDRKDRIFLRTRSQGSWSDAEEIAAPRDGIFRCALASTPAGDLWFFWTQRDGDLWNVWSRLRKAGKWLRAEKLTTAGSSNFVRAAASPDGSVYIAYQSFRNGQSDIFLRASKNAAWQPEQRISDSPANDWEPAPAIATAADGSVFLAWDTYDKGNCDVCLRTLVCRDLVTGLVVHLTRTGAFV